MEHFHYDTFAVPPDPIDPIEKLKISFHTDLNGDISSVSIPLEENVKSIIFARVAEKQMFERAFLNNLSETMTLWAAHYPSDLTVLS